MVNKCPPGVICIENLTLVILFLSMIIILIFIFNSNIRKKISKPIKQNINYNIDYPQNMPDIYSQPGYSFSNIDNDVLMNPYEPPVRDNRIFPFIRPTNRIPINIQTQTFDTSYRQVGILTRKNGKETILPLMGAPLITNRDKWNFYTLSEKNNMIKLPITFKNRRCMSEQGCDNIYNGDIVYVEGYNDAFKVTTYDSNIMRYLPFL
jgi:hypothetical protein